MHYGLLLVILLQLAHQILYLKCIGVVGVDSPYCTATQTLKLLTAQPFKINSLIDYVIVPSLRSDFDPLFLNLVIPVEHLFLK